MRLFHVISSGIAPRSLAMPLDETSESARPYRCGMVLLCMGALINWLGFAQNYEHPVRYIGIACVVAGAFLIAGAVFCWARSAPRAEQTLDSIDIEAQNRDGIHVIQVENVQNSKPPDYETIAETMAPPSYDEAIRLDPARLQSTSVCVKTTTV